MDDHYWSLPESAVDLFTGDLFQSFNHTQSRALLQHYKEWVQQCRTLFCPHMAGHPSHAMYGYTLRQNHRRENNFDVAICLAVDAKYKIRPN